MLIVLGVIVVGIAVAVGLMMFSDSAINENRDALASDLTNLGARAHAYYRRPTAMGGGGNSFTMLTATAAGMALLTNNPVNGNGSYSIALAGSGSGSTANVELVGIGNELYNGSPVSVRVRVYPDRDSVWIVN